MLLALASAGKPMSNSQIEDAVVADLKIPASLSTAIHSGNRTELQYRLAWARTKAKMSGWIESPTRENWMITSKGIDQK